MVFVTEKRGANQLALHSYFSPLDSGFPIPPDKIGAWNRANVPLRKPGKKFIFSQKHKPLEIVVMAL